MGFFSEFGSIETNDLGRIMGRGGVFGYSPGRLVGRITLQAASQPETYCSTSIKQCESCHFSFVFPLFAKENAPFMID